MIQEFTVENYRSIKTKQTISFLANKKMNNGREDYLCVQVNDNTKLLKFGVLYGYNAAGKSNLLLAMDYLRDLILSGPDTKDQDTEFVPFALDDESINKSGTFSLVFFIERIKYEYSVTLDKERIHFENLNYFPEGRKAKLFSRTHDDENKVSKIVIGADCKLLSKDKIILNGNTLENSTVLYSYQRSNVHSVELDKVVSYFKNTLLPIITPRVLLKDWSMNKLVKDNTQKDFYVKLLSKADFQISDLEIKEETIKKEELLFSHSTKNGTHLISEIDESKGTQRYFGLSG
ncbi:MAG: AAA family ATPase, partial [Sphaerochaetaceae bacterium]